MRDESCRLFFAKELSGSAVVIDEDGQAAKLHERNPKDEWRVATVALTSK